MDNQSCVYFDHSEDEVQTQDERQLSRISMFLNIDISKRNNFHNIVPSERNARNNGGGLFGAVEDRYVTESLMSFPVPNKFFAQSRNFCHKYDKFSKHSAGQNKKETMSFDPNDYGRQIEMDSDQYSMYNNRRMHRQNLKESYRCPKRFATHYEEKNHNCSGYKDYHDKPRRENHRRKPCQEIPETLPEYDYEYSPQMDRTKKQRYEKNHEGNVNFYKVFYNLDTPWKPTDKSYILHSTECPRKFLAKSKKSTRKVCRQSSGCANSDCRQAYNQHDYHKLPRNNAPDFSSDHEYYDSTPGLNYSKPALRKNDYNYNNNPHLYANKVQPYKKKSVDFLDLDCEIPYNNSHIKSNYSRSQKHKSNLGLSTTEIPHKHKQRRYNHSDLYEPDVKRSESGCNSGFLRTHQESCPAHHSFVHRNRSQCCETSDRHYRKAQKAKVSEYFKKSKCKSRTKCSQNPHTQYDSRCHGSKSNMKLKNCKTCLDQSQSASSTSCIPIRYQTPPLKCAKNSVKRTKCTAYPTNYRDKCPQSNNEQEVVQRHSLSKVNCSQSDCENKGISKCSREYSSDSGEFQKTVSLPNHICAKDLDNFDNVEYPKDCALSTPSKNSHISRCCPPENSLNCSTLDGRTCFSSCPISKKRTQNPIQPSTINLCLTICTADGNLMNPTNVTTSLAKPDNSQCNQMHSRTRTTRQDRSNHKLPSTCSSKTLLGTPVHQSCNYIQNQAACYPSKINSFSMLSKKSRIISKQGSGSKQPACRRSSGILNESNCGSDCNSHLPAKVRAMITPCQSEINSTSSENAFRCVRHSAGKGGLPRSRAQTFCNKSNSKRTIDCAKAHNAKNCKRSLETCAKDSLDKIPRACKVRSSSFKKPSTNYCNKKNVNKIYVADEVFCPTNCEYPDSLVENLKRELLDNLKSEQESNAQLLFQRPTAHVMFLPYVSDTITPKIRNNARQSDTHGMCWTPL